MAQALCFLQRTLSNCGTNAAIDARRWKYQWKRAIKDNYAQWWTDEESLLTALIRYDQKEAKLRPRAGTILDFTAKVHSEEISDIRVKIVRENLNTLNSNTSTIGPPKIIQERINTALQDRFKIERPTDYDAAQIIRYFVRNPAGPIVKTALLCWPETALFALDYLETRNSLNQEKDVGPFDYFNEVIPTDELHTLFSIEAAEKKLLEETAALLSRRGTTTLKSRAGGKHTGLKTAKALKEKLKEEGYCKWVSGETPNRGSFMAKFIDLLREDFGSNERFDQKLYEYVCSLSGLCKLLIQLGSEEKTRVSLPNPPVTSTSRVAIPRFLPETPAASRKIWRRANTTFATLDLIAALYYAAIYGPKDITQLFSEPPEHKTFTGASPMIRPEATTLRRHPINLFAHCYRGGRLIPTGEAFIAYPGQSCIITAKGRYYSSNYLRNVRLIESTNRRISDTHLEIAYDANNNGGWTLFDRGTDGSGSTNGTLIIRGAEYICLGRATNASPVDVLFHSVQHSFEVVFRRPRRGDIFNEGPYESKHDEVAKELWCGVVLQPRDIICPSAPIIEYYLKTNKALSPAKVQPSDTSDSYMIDVPAAHALPWKA